MIRRREFIAGISGAAVWPITARAQQRALPLIGWLHPETPETHQAVMPLFFKGLAEVAIFRHIDSTKREHSHLRAPFLADAGSCPGNCSGLEEATGVPSSSTVYDPRRLRASGRDGAVS
jgi:hypothetical protein